MQPYTVVLADDHVMFRQGIKNFIEKIDGIQICGEVNDGKELLDYLKTLSPDLIILDIAMPRLRGLEAFRQIKKQYPNIKVLILSMYGNQEFVRQTVTEGAEGFILKEEPVSDLISAIKAIKNGKTYFSPLISETLIGMVREEKKSEQLLTEREEEVLLYLSRGMRAQKISNVLQISIHTVRRHRYNIMKKLNIQSTADLIKYSLFIGLAD